MRKLGITQVAIGGLLGLALLAAPANAQRPLILVGGLNMATVEGDDVDEIDSRRGIFFGVGTGLALSPSISVSPFVAYVQRGFESEDGVVEANITYIDVPVFLGVSVPLGETFSLSLSAGPRISFNLGCELEGEGISIDCNEFEEIGSDPESIDFGLIGDVGLGFALSPTMNLGIGAGYDMGMNDVFADIEAKHRAPFFYAALSFLMGGA